MKISNILLFSKQLYKDYQWLKYIFIYDFYVKFYSNLNNVFLLSNIFTNDLFKTKYYEWIFKWFEEIYQDKLYSDIFNKLRNEENIKKFFQRHNWSIKMLSFDENLKDIYVLILNTVWYHFFSFFLIYKGTSKKDIYISPFHNYEIEDQPKPQLNLKASIWWKWIFLEEYVEIINEMTSFFNKKFDNIDNSYWFYYLFLKDILYYKTYLKELIKRRIYLKNENKENFSNKIDTILDWWITKEQLENEFKEIFLDEETKKYKISTIELWKLYISKVKELERYFIKLTEKIDIWYSSFLDQLFENYSNKYYKKYNYMESFHLWDRW